MVTADLVRPSLRRSVHRCDFAPVVARSRLAALSARVAIPLPFSPVPVTGQTLAVLLLAERGWERRAPTAFLAMLLGNGAIYACGLPWLAALVAFDRALARGLLPFVLGDIAKLALAMAVLPAGWRLLGRP